MRNDFSFDVKNTNGNRKGDFFKSEEFRSRQATEGQINAYLNMCEQRDIEPDENYANWTAGEISDVIDEMINSITPNQKAIIERKVKELNEAGFKVNEPDYNTLTGGKEGTASKMIESLITMQNQHHETCPPYGDALKKAVSWYLCPDIEWKDGVKKIVKLDGRLWRKMTPEEFAKEIQREYTHSELLKTMRSNQNKYFQWRRKLITQKQIDHIRTLENRLKDMSSSSVGENSFAVDENGNLIEVAKKKTKEDAGMSLTGYAELDDLDIQMLTKEQGDMYISILDDALKNPATKSNLKDLVADLEFELIRPTVSESDKEDVEIEQAQEFIYSLFAMVGHDDEELITLSDQPRDESFKNRLIEYVMDAQEKELINTEDVANLADKYQVADTILNKK